MAYRDSYGASPFGITLTAWVKRLLLVNVVVWLADWVLGASAGVPLNAWLALEPSRILSQPWGPLTYMFAHAGFWHLFWNSLGLVFFGPVLEERWGSPEFLKFYLIAGLGGALLSFVLPGASVVGASAAVYGLMLAYATYFPYNRIYLWGILPIEARWFVVGLSALSIFYLVTGTQAGTAHLAHLGGFAAAFAYLRSPFAPSAWGPTISRRGGRSRSGVRGWAERMQRKLRRGAEPQSPSPARPPVSRRPPVTSAPVAVPRERDEIDSILDKISSRGIDSLDPGERRKLQEFSRQRREPPAA